MAIKPFVDRPDVNINENVIVIPVSGGMDTHAIDKFRQGINIRSPRDFRCILSPWISDKGIPRRQRERFDPTIEKNHWGQPKLFEDPSPARKAGVQDGPGPAPWDDIVGILNPVAYIEDPGTQQYPVVLLSPNFLDPAQMDGVIEPLSIRESLTNSSIGGPVIAHSIKAALQPNVGPEIMGFGTVITRFIEFFDLVSFEEQDINGDPVLVHGIHPWIDSQNIALEEGDFKIPEEGYADHAMHELPPFSDVPPPARPQISAKTLLQPPIISMGLFIDEPRLGIFGKSAPCGFENREGNYIVNQFGTGCQWVNGVDSIAFSGWIK